VRPWSLVMDTRGIYFDPRTESDLEHILQNADMPQGLLDRAVRVRQLLVDRQISKYNTGRAPLPGIDAQGRKVILVPGQVEDDASIRVGTVEGMRRNLDLLRAARAKEPSAFLIYKPHPDVEAGKRQGAIPRDIALQYADTLAEDCSIARLWPVVDAVHTLTSLSGFEALLRGKEVCVYGNPFYAGWGLTQDQCVIPRRSRKLTLAQLVAGTVILYPFYFDWKTKEICNIETVIHRLSRKEN